MRKGFYTKLAASNIKKNSRTYIPYIITCIITAAMFYIINSLSNNESIKKLYGGDIEVGLGDGGFRLHDVPVTVIALGYLGFGLVLGAGADFIHLPEDVL